MGALVFLFYKGTEAYLTLVLVNVVSLSSAWFAPPSILNMKYVWYLCLASWQQRHQRHCLRICRSYRNRLLLRFILPPFHLLVRAYSHGSLLENKSREKKKKAHLTHPKWIASSPSFKMQVWLSVQHLVESYLSSNVSWWQYMQFLLKQFLAHIFHIFTKARMPGWMNDWMNEW